MVESLVMDIANNELGVCKTLVVFKGMIWRAAFGRYKHSRFDLLLSLLHFCAFSIWDETEKCEHVLFIICVTE